MLDLLANLSEILAGIAIMFAAARAWPVLGAMNQNLSRRRLGASSAEDLRQLSVGLARELDIPNPHFHSTREAREGLMLVLADAHADNLHLQIGGEDPERPGSVRVRVDGNLRSICTLSAAGYSRLIEEFKAWAGMAEGELWGRGRGTQHFGEREFSVLIRLAESIRGPALTAHLLDTSQTELPVSALGMPPEHWQLIEPLLELERGGLLIFSGLTGSGKTMSLYTSLNLLDPHRRNIVTVEDPVEITRPGVTQIEVDSRALNIGDAFSLARNMDPDVLMVGELRPDTVRSVLRSYYDGCLTLTTAPSRSALATLGYLESYSQVGIRELLFPLVIVAQRLMRALCPECSVPVSPVGEDASFINRVLLESGKTWADLGERFGEAYGCEKCDVGYQGRLACYEALQVDFEILDAVRGNRNPRLQMEHAVSRGFIPMQFHALALASSHRVSLSEVKRVVAGLTTTTGAFT